MDCEQVLNKLNFLLGYHLILDIIQLNVNSFKLSHWFSIRESLILPDAKSQQVHDTDLDSKNELKKKNKEN